MHFLHMHKRPDCSLSIQCVLLQWERTKLVSARLLCGKRPRSLCSSPTLAAYYTVHMQLCQQSMSAVKFICTTRNISSIIMNHIHSRLVQSLRTAAHSSFRRYFVRRVRVLPCICIRASLAGSQLTAQPLEDTHSQSL